MTEITTRLTEFYAAPNEVDRANAKGAVGDLLGGLVARLDPGGKRTLLPARVAGMTRWYGVAPTDRDARLLLEEMQSWLGPPVSPRVAVVRSDADPVDGLALQLAPTGTILRVDIPTGWLGQARENVSILLDTWSLAPERGLEAPRPLGRVLRNFYEGLLAGDREASEAALADIRFRSLLSPTNVRFLHIELIGTRGTPAELRDDSSLRDVTLLSRPPAVTEHLASAANALFFEPVLEAPATVDWHSVGQQLEELWPGLVTHPSQVLSLAGARCLAVTEVLADQPRPSVLVALRDVWGDDDLVAAVARRSEIDIGVAVPPAGPLQLYHAGEYALALQAIDDQKVADSLVALALHAALNLGDADSAAKALGIVDRLSDSSRAELLGNAVERAFYEQLVSKTSGMKVPQGWIEWLAGDWPDRPDLLSEWSAEWHQASGLAAEDADAFAVGFLDALNDQRRGRTRNGLPVFIDWLLDHGGLDLGAVSLAVTMLDIMLSSEPGRVERKAGLELLDEILGTGCSASEYAEILNALRGQLGQVGPRDGGWLAASIDLLLLSASQDQAARGALIGECFAVATSWGARTDAIDELLLSKVFGDAGLVFPPRERPVSDDGPPGHAHRPFRKVGIYSLLEPAANAAARWIKEMWPGTEVTLSHDHVNSRALEALVHGSDVMLVQTSRAKHAATNAITAATTDKARLVLIHGRGATAILRGLVHWVDGDPT